MAAIKYVGPHDAVELREHGGIVVKRNETVELPTELAKSLAKQKDAWVASDTPRKRSAKKPERIADPPEGSLAEPAEGTAAKKES